MMPLRGGARPSALRLELVAIARELQGLALEVGAHSHSHPLVDARPLPAVLEDVDMLAASLRGWIARARQET